MSEDTEVIAVDVDLDGRTIEFILTDIIEALDKQYAVLQTEDNILEEEDRTLFASIQEIDGEDSFTILSDPLEIEMVAANATLNIVEDLMVRVRSEVRSILSLVPNTDKEIDNPSNYGIIRDRLASLLDALNQEPDSIEEENDAE